MYKGFQCVLMLLILPNLNLFAQTKTITGSAFITGLVQYQKSAFHTLFAATKKGVYYTNDTMNSWELYSLNLPNVEVTDIKIQEQSNKLYISTYGRGI